MLPASHPPGGPRCNRRLNRAQKSKGGRPSTISRLIKLGRAPSGHWSRNRSPWTSKSNEKSPYGRRTIVTLPDLTEHDAGDPPDDPDEYRWFVMFKPDRPIPRGWPYAGEAEFESRVGDLQKLDD